MQEEGGERIKGRSCRANVYIDSKAVLGGRMGGTQLFLLASLAFASLTSLANGAPL